LARLSASHLGRARLTCGRRRVDKLGSKSFGMVPTTGASLSSRPVGLLNQALLVRFPIRDDEERNHAEVRHDRRFVLCQPCHDLDLCRGPLLLPQEMLSPGSDLLRARADVCRAGGRAGNYAADRHDRASAPHGRRPEWIGGRPRPWEADRPPPFLPPRPTTPPPPPPRPHRTTPPARRAARPCDEAPRGPAARVPGRPKNVRPAVSTIAEFPGRLIASSRGACAKHPERGVSH